MDQGKVPKTPGFLSIVVSVLSAFFGVQSNKNRERDFVHGKLWHYIVVGFLATIAFMFAVWFAVSMVLDTTPPPS